MGMHEHTQHHDASDGGSLEASLHEDAGLARVDALLAHAAAGARAEATAVRMNRVAEVSGRGLVTSDVIARIEPGSESAAEALAETRAVAWHSTVRGRQFPAMRLAAGIALMLSVGAAVMALRHPGVTPAVPTVIAAKADATTDFAMLDALFASGSQTGATDSLSAAWSDAQSLDQRVSAEWASDELFKDTDSKTEESM